MPSLFDEHNSKLAAKRIAAAKSDAEINIADARALHQHLSTIIASDDATRSKDAVKAAKRQRALEDPHMVPVVAQIQGSLRRLGISIEAASDMNALNDALKARNWSTEERLRLKSLLAQIGII
jgi:hypothetical protein